MPTTPTPTLRLRSARDVLDFIPRELGGSPEWSLVLVLLRGSVVSLLLRVDLPPPDATDAQRREWARQIARRLGHVPGHRRLTSVFGVVYAPEPDILTVPCAVEAAAVRHELHRMRLPAELWHVGRRRWSCYDCRDQACCPPDGRPTTQLTPGAADPGPAPTPGATRLERIDAAARRWSDRLGTDVLDDPSAGCDEDATDTAFAAWNRWTRDAGPSDDELGLLLAALERRSFRDAVMLGAVTGTVPDRLVATLAQAPEAAGRAVGHGTEPPDRRALTWLVDRSVELARLGSGTRRVSPLVLAGWAEWCLGRCAVSARMLEEAQVIDPRHVLANRLHRMLALGLVPQWVRVEGPPDRPS